MAHVPKAHQRWPVLDSLPSSVQFRDMLAAILLRTRPPQLRGGSSLASMKKSRARTRHLRTFQRGSPGLTPVRRTCRDKVAAIRRERPPQLHGGSSPASTKNRGAGRGICVPAQKGQPLAHSRPAYNSAICSRQFSSARVRRSFMVAVSSPASIEKSRGRTRYLRTCSKGASWALTRLTAF
jgi:hypothetical protein